MEFDIQSYVGAGPSKLGMTEDEVIAAMKVQPKRFLNWQKRPVHAYIEHHVNFGFGEQGKADHLGFGPKAKVTFKGIDVLSDKTALRQLLEIDGHPYEHVGFINLLSLGIMLDGFHGKNEEDEQDDRAVSMFIKGGLDDLLPEFKPYTLTG